MERITSRSNPLCAHFRKLASSAAYRRESGQFLCDSPKLLGEILLWRPELLRTMLCTEPETLPALPEGVRAVSVPESLMEYLSPARTPQGILSACALPEQSLPETLTGRRYAVLDGVQDPGNVGTILRTADALFADGLFLVNGCADPWQPKAVRASMGAILRCPVWACGAGEMKSILSRSGIPLCGAALRQDTRDARALPEGKAAVAIGSEGRGLSEEVLGLCDLTVRIPMAEHCESLNAAAAAAVLLWELARRDAPGK